MRRRIGLWPHLVVGVLLTAAVAIRAAPASACDIAVPEATVTFIGSATDIDGESANVTFEVIEVEATSRYESSSGEPEQPVPFPAVGDDVVVTYYERDDVDLLAVGESYRVEASTMSAAPVRWASTALELFTSSNGDCGAEVRPAGTTRADGTSLESPAGNVARRVDAGVYRWQTALVIVAGLVAAAVVVGRARARSRDRTETDTSPGPEAAHAPGAGPGTVPR